MSIAHPITKPSQMRQLLVCKKADLSRWNTDHSIWWARGENPNPANPEEAAQMAKMLILRDKLLAFGGEQACMPYTEEDYDAIMQRGQLFYGKGTRFRKGEPCHCHSNAAYLWDVNRGHCQIATGYALSDDGMWRQHSWVVQPLTTKWRVWETTVSRVAYFGFIMTDEECERFLADNW